MTTINCSACGFTNTVPEDRELEETRAEVRRLQVHGSAPAGFALVSREMLRTLVDDVAYGNPMEDEVDAMIDKALGPDAFTS